MSLHYCCCGIYVCEQDAADLYYCTTSVIVSWTKNVL